MLSKSKAKFSKAQFATLIGLIFRINSRFDIKCNQNKPFFQDKIAKKTEETVNDGHDKV